MRGSILRFLLVIAAVTIFYQIETVTVKAKETDYKKEFPAYLQKAVSEQKIDLNEDGNYP